MFDRIRDKSAIVGVMGLGYVGLPLVRTFVNAGFSVVGYDIDRIKIEKLLTNRSYIDSVSDEWLAASTKRFQPTDNPAELHKCDAVLMCVPTPLTASHEPDLSFVVRTTKTIREHMREGMLIVLESTTYPGTTQRIVRPVLDEFGSCEVDYYLGYSPEREDPGSKYSTENIPKLVSGVGICSLLRTKALYEAAFHTVVPVSKCEVAEAAKILENTYRCVNIALVNELKVIFEGLGIDVWEVIDAAKTKPFGFQPFYPGPGLGGHCIPIDPFYLSWLARQAGMEAKFITMAGEINSAMPDRVVNRVVEALNDQRKAVNGSKILIIGVAYKPNVNDPRESPAFDIMSKLADRGASLSYHDPHIPELPTMRNYQTAKLASIPLTPDNIHAADAVVIVTNHDGINWKLLDQQAKCIVDTRGALRHLTNDGGAMRYSA